MKNWGTVYSTVKPEAMKIDDYSVWIRSNIKEVERTTEDGTRTEYEYNEIQYDKNEYITSQFGQITDLQLALCELYETLF